MPAIISLNSFQNSPSGSYRKEISALFFFLLNDWDKCTVITCLWVVAMLLSTFTGFLVSALITTVALFDVLITFAANKHRNKIPYH